MFGGCINCWGESSCILTIRDWLNRQSLCKDDGLPKRGEIPSSQRGLPGYHKETYPISVHYLHEILQQDFCEFTPFSSSCHLIIIRSKSTLLANTADFSL